MLTLKVEELLDRRGTFLDLRLLAGHAGLERQITAPRIQKQGLVLVGVGRIASRSYSGSWSN